MTKVFDESEEDLLSDLEQNLQDNLYSKSSQEEDFVAPNLSPEEFKKLWNEKKIDVSYTENTDDSTVEEDQKIVTRYEGKINANTLNIDQELLIKILEQSVSEINSNNESDFREVSKRGVLENSSETISRVIRIPLSKQMEDQLIKIRRLLNELHQTKNPRKVIDDYQVILALLHWATKQLETDKVNPSLI